LPEDLTFTLKLSKTFTIKPVLLIFSAVVIPASASTSIPAFALTYILTSAPTFTIPMISVAIFTFTPTFTTLIVSALAPAELTLLSTPKITAALSPATCIPTEP
jgi:hypothetical protein